MPPSQGVVRNPSVSETSFNCPHCGAFAKQFWFDVKADSMRPDGHPSWPDPEDHRKLMQNAKPEAKKAIEEFSAKLLGRKPFLRGGKETTYTQSVYNLFLSQCFNCQEIAVWMGASLLWPSRGEVPLPNPDMPIEAISDYEEAAQIVGQSPRGAAALLRLVIQKICVTLGGTGALNKDIGDLVAKGLDPRVQQALDVVRVIGNNAVHPGELNLRDDKETAHKLFVLVNMIVDIMITQPRHLSDMFKDLPPSSLAAIDRRDRSTGSQSES